ncbi:SIMPL domain-containing protein [Thermaerobacillus caldiproteolyticus]|uniref:SIMPL domain-containing protein n=1 Tax=Thermaerobacillus caldiproteolyticus TaxID=247480 RepID=UPI00188A774F|nr:SIMPL domain-containing protein [Anoxybacillus caldiproteolyticus]QPA32860.1 SIMPL domain-containing protein [Anoxybacillus caldiproteolyticus]
MQDWHMHHYLPTQRGKHSPQTITVTGQGTVTVKPDTVIITLGIRTEHTNVREALSENAQRAGVMIQALKAIGVHEEDIDTASFSIYPKYNYTNGISVLVGYEVEHIFDITVRDTKTVGNIYETAVANGANIARHIQFKLANEQPYYQQALAIAVKNAKEKAFVIAHTLGLPLHDMPIQIKEESLAPTLSPSLPSTVVLAEQQTAPPIQTQDIIISAVAQAIFTY